MDKAICIARLRIEAGGMARALLDSIEPDNRPVPGWLRVECTTDEEALECIVEVEGCGDPRRVLSLRNTIDDFMQSVKAALSALDNTVGSQG